MSCYFCSSGVCQSFGTDDYAANRVTSTCSPEFKTVDASFVSGYMNKIELTCEALPPPPSPYYSQTVSCPDGVEIVEILGTGSVSQGIITSVLIKCGSLSADAITGKLALKRKWSRL